MGLLPLLRRALTMPLPLIRNGDRTVVWTPEVPMGLGNHLYLWLWADIRRRRGDDVRVLVRPSMAPWLPHFPGIADLVIDATDVAFRDRRRVELWPQFFNDNFFEPDLDRFITDRVLTAPAFAQASGADSRRVVLNVRRGDYYSDPDVRGRYSFDIVAYVREALEEAVTQGPIGELHIVSDGMDWCRARLGWTGEFADRLTFARRGATGIDNFVEVSTSRRLILGNSTFSYWGGYVSNVLYNNPASVIAPIFHRRDMDNGVSFQINPRWTIIRDIPGGWDS